jgi:hypothetical protein
MSRQTALVTIALLLTFMSTQIVDTSASEPMVPPLGSPKFSTQKNKAKSKSAKRQSRRSKKQKTSSASSQDK